MEKKIVLVGSKKELLSALLMIPHGWPGIHCTETRDIAIYALEQVNEREGHIFILTVEDHSETDVARCSVHVNVAGAVHVNEGRTTASLVNQVVQPVDSARAAA